MNKTCIEQYKLVLDELSLQFEGLTIKKSPGGAKTNKNGLAFEDKTAITRSSISFGRTKHFGTGKSHYYIPFRINNTNYRYLTKHGLQKYFQKYHIFNTESKCKKVQPDECFLDETNKVMIILEKKAQSCAGTADEKLQTGLFKIYKYEKLYLNYKIYYAFVLQNWFYERRDVYQHELEYLKKHKISVFWGDHADYFDKLTAYLQSLSP